MTITAIILAGGKNLRLGRNKALEMIGGISLIERVVERVRPLSSQIIIVTSQNNHTLPDIPGVRYVEDVFPGKGPLGGIYTGLLRAGTACSLAVACDMPFLNIELINHMKQSITGYDAVVPRLCTSMVEPLHSIYSENILPVLERRLRNEKLSVHAFLEEVNVRYIEEDECKRFDSELLSFFNINQQSDLDRALEIVGQEATGICNTK